MKTITILLLTATAASAYTLHEWGTFTTVAGSDGVLLTGLEREEAPLPTFTYSHYGLENGNLRVAPDEIVKEHGRMPILSMMKGMDRPLRGVTVKMETPVIYFHSDKAFDVSVKVGFNGGTISQWYPDRSGGETLPVPKARKTVDIKDVEDWAIDFTKPWKGSIEWQARVLSPEESRNTILFKPWESLHWMRPRVPEANAVRTANGETEGFLFYRGIGAFNPGLTTTVGADETLRLKNRTGGDIPFAFVFEKTAGTTRWMVMKEGLKAGAAAEVPVSGFTESSAAFDETVYREMVAGLTATGLLESEARAMVETWWNSYFAQNGLRVFWVVPEAKTEAILPLEVSPKPEKSVRVIVGRSEVLRPTTEREWLALSQDPDKNRREAWANLCSHDRFGLAYLKRLEALGATAAK
ncbi:hypothetical protein OKA04_21820 [Luteolibacter flavescens]|uniref:DUF2931 family protein n=1 Tax=Luteolibacter flavescens TaxID=1859460 RepID=A0ABT3FVY7_9BACT|nr:hypothetical protein [Luteolibacter flavescens]MCW1887391.1 hypothetical protein [Luteolibacter flavescens]